MRVLEKLYKEILFHSENGVSFIDSPNFLTSEVHKSTGVPKPEVARLFYKLAEIGFIEKVPDTPYSYSVKRKMNFEELEIILANNP